MNRKRCIEEKEEQRGKAAGQGSPRGQASERVNENEGRRGTWTEDRRKGQQNAGELILSYSDEFFEGQFRNAGILD